MAHTLRRMERDGLILTHPTAPSFAIDARGPGERYGATVALAGVDIRVPTGTVTAVLGPNGAGRTTAMRVLEVRAVRTSDLTAPGDERTDLDGARFGPPR